MRQLDHNSSSALGLGHIVLIICIILVLTAILGAVDLGDYRVQMYTIPEY